MQVLCSNDVFILLLHVRKRFMKKKILLINPPYPMEESPAPPFGLMSLAAFMLENNFDVRIEDYIVNPYSRERVRSVINEYRPDVIGATGVTMNIKKALNILREYHEESPDSVIMMGGPHVSFDAHNILSDNSHVDFIVRGEGELTSVELLNSLDNPGAYRSIRGISYRDNGTIIHNETRDFIPDINILPYPARHLVQLSKYKALGLPINMITSRGCPYECIFCVGSKMVGRKVRYYDIKRVVDEFELLSSMGFKQINIVDDLFTSNKKRCTAICEEIMARGIKHEWTAFARVDTVSSELLEVMKAAGCTMLCFGIESGNQEILNTIKKKITLEKIKNAVRLCNDAGVIPMASYIMGLPGETPETVRETLDFARKLCISYGFHILSPFPGTEVRDMAEKYGLRIMNSDWDNYDANRSVCESTCLPHEEVDAVVNKFNDGINRMILDTLKKYQRGETLSPDNRTMAQNIISIDFNYKLINAELVEHYDPKDANGAGLSHFIDYVAVNSGLERDLVSAELDRLFKLGCLKNEGSNSTLRISWS
jgi:anaerobic magnesium-protoporphyrin IX monomethyl ester cyclase